MKHLTPTQLDTLRQHLDAEKPQPHIVMLRILMETGIRADELVKLKLSDVDSESRRILVTGSKGSKNRVMLISPKTLEGLMHLGLKSACMADASNSLMTLCNENYKNAASHERDRYNAKQWLREQWRSLRVSLGLKDLGMHALRHTVAVTLLKATDDIRKVQVTLGHKNINNTLKYLEELNQESVAQELDFIMTRKVS